MRRLPAIALICAVWAMLVLPGGAMAQMQAMDSGGEASGGGTASGAEVFAVEALNEGLPEWDGADLSTPRATMEGFVELTEAGNFAAAAHYMNLNRLSPADQRELGPMLARRFGEVLDRQVWLDWADLPDRPDALDASAPSQAPMAGLERRSLRLAIVDLNDRPVELRLNRYQVGDQDPVWLIADRTAAYVPALYERYGPGDLERSLPDWLRMEAAWGVTLWQLIAVPVVVAMALLAGVALNHVVEWLGRRLDAPMSKRKGVRWLPQMVRSASVPIAIFAAAGLVAIANSSLFSFSGPASAFISTAIVVLMVIAGAMAILRMIGTVLDIITSNFVSSIDDEGNAESRKLFTNISVARRIVILLALLIGAAIVVIQLNLSQTLGISLLASAGVVSVILGFAAQAVLGNILASVQLAIAKPIRIGDAVQFRGEWGYVEEINYTFVLIRTWDLRRLIVPVRTFVAEPFENWSMSDAATVMPIEIELDPSADVETLRKAFDEMLRADADWDGSTEPMTLVIGQTARSIIVRFYTSGANPSDAWNVYCRMREQIFAYLRDAEGDRWLVRERQQFLNAEGKVVSLDGERAEQLA